jgi:hypothetical protein
MRNKTTPTDDLNHVLSKKELCSTNREKQDMCINILNKEQETNTKCKSDKDCYLIEKNRDKYVVNVVIQISVKIVIQ